MRRIAKTMVLMAMAAGWLGALGTRTAGAEEIVLPPQIPPVIASSTGLAFPWMVGP